MEGFVVFWAHVKMRSPEAPIISVILDETVAEAGQVRLMLCFLLCIETCHSLASHPKTWYFFLLSAWVNDLILGEDEPFKLVYETGLLAKGIIWLVETRD